MALRILLAFSRLVQTVLFFTMILLDARFLLLQTEFSFKTMVTDWFVPESLLTSSLPLSLEKHFKLLALCGICLEFLILVVKWRLSIVNRLMPLLFGALNAAIAANVFADPGRSMSNADYSRKRLLQLVFDTVTLLTCVVDLIAMVGSGTTPVINGSKCPEVVSLHCSPNRRMPFNPMVKSTMGHQMNGNGIERRQRRDSTSPGRVGVMLGALSLGHSDTSNYNESKQSNYYNKSTILMPARFQYPSSPSSASSFTTAAPYSRFDSQSASTYNEQSYLWPSRFNNQPIKKTLLNDGEDACSVFSSVSQRAFGHSPMKGSNCSHDAHQSSVDWFWKAVICLILVFNFTTNAVVLYYLLSRK